MIAPRCVRCVYISAPVQVCDARGVQTLVQAVDDHFGDEAIVAVSCGLLRHLAKSDTAKKLFVEIDGLKHSATVLEAHKQSPRVCTQVCPPPQPAAAVPRIYAPALVKQRWWPPPRGAVSASGVMCLWQHGPSWRTNLSQAVGAGACGHPERLIGRRCRPPQHSNMHTMSRCAMEIRRRTTLLCGPGL